MFKQMRQDIATIRDRDPASRSAFEAWALYNGYKALRSHRRANWLYRHGLYFLARWESQRCVRRTGIEIHPAATIGQRTAPTAPRSRGRKVALWSGGAIAVAAAATALALVVGTPKPTAAEAFDQMLAQLTDEQCNALVASYSNDIFLWSIEE